MKLQNKKRNRVSLLAIFFSLAFLVVGFFPAISRAQLQICIGGIEYCQNQQYQGSGGYQYQPGQYQENPEYQGGPKYNGGQIYTPGNEYQYAPGDDSTVDVEKPPAYVAVNNAPVGIFCPTITNYNTVQPLIRYATCIIQRYVIPIAFTLAVILFFYGSASFILNLGNEEARAKAKKYLIWGILMIFVIVSIWGLVTLLTNFFGFKTVIPQLQ